VEVLEQEPDWPQADLHSLFCPIPNLSSAPEGTVCIRGYTGILNGLELEGDDGPFDQFKVPVCTPDGVISTSSRVPLNIPADSAICVFGASLRHYHTKIGDASVLNLGKSAFWIVGDADLLPADLKEWWSTRPAITELVDLSLTSFGVNYEAALPSVDCDPMQLAEHVSADVPRLRQEHKEKMELVSLMGCKNFASACCGLPFCRAKVLKENVTVAHDITLYKCSAARPHRCATFCWRFMSQAQFRLAKDDRVLTFWLRDAAVAAILGMSADDFSLLTPAAQQETVAARRSGGQYLGSITCERPSGDFNKGKPVLYCSKLERVQPAPVK